MPRLRIVNDDLTLNLPNSAEDLPLLGPDDLLTYAEAAKHMRCSVATIKRMVKREELETIGLPPKVFVTRQGIAAYQQRTLRNPIKGDNNAAA